MKNIKTRFAPSPTGMMHIGSVRTALYAFLVAKKNKGVFSLRVEDTDRDRFVEGAIEDIVGNMKWLGLNFDGVPIYQSERKAIYKKYADELIKKSDAYEKDGAVWFKIPTKGEVKFTDLIGNKEVVFDLKKQKDFVLLKSDGFPTYHLAHVVDDYEMETNPVIRGDEWLSSVPKHVLTFQALGWEVPQYAHLPLILGTDRSKLSKRHGAMGVSEFRKDGFLPEAILNYMAFLGWTPPSGKEILTLEEIIQEFDLKDVHIAPAVFDIIKLEWMNGVYIRNLSDEELTKRLQEFLMDLPAMTASRRWQTGHPAKDKIAPVVPLVKERITKLSDFVPLTNFIFEKPEYDIEVFKKIRIDNQKEILEKVMKRMENLEKPWKADDFEQAFRKLAEDEKIKVGDMFQLIRVAVSGQLVTPPLFESMKIIGEDEILKRVKNVTEKYPNFV